MALPAGELAVNLPLKGLAVGAHQDVLARLLDAGARHVWADEFNGADSVAALATFAAWQPEISLTSAIVNVFTRGPSLLAMSAATLASLAPGRTTFGIGSSSAVVVEQWNGIPFTRPYTTVANTVRFLREILTTGAADRTGPALGVDGFRLAVVPDIPPRLALGALGPRMQRLAAQEADVLITGMLAAADLARIRENVDDVERSGLEPLELHVGVFVVPPGPPEAVDVAARRHLCAYLPVPAYAAFQRWLGRGDELEPMLTSWMSGDRRGAVAAIPDRVVRDLVITGSLDECAAGVRAYLEAGADCVNLMIPTSAAIDHPQQVEFLCDLLRGALG